MKIGIDARFLSLPLTGIGRYTLEMCLALSKISGVSLYLYSSASICTEKILNLDCVSIRTCGWNNALFRVFWAESYLPLWAKKDKVDIFWGPAHRLPYWLSKDIPCVVTIHDLVWKYAGDTMRPLSRCLDRYQMPIAVRLADQVVVISQSTANAVNKEFSINADKLKIILLGSSLMNEPKSFDYLKQLGIEGLYFLFIGTLEPRKNLVRLLKSYANLPEEVKSKVSFVIVGAKGWGGDLQRVIARLGINKNIKLLGYVDDFVLATLYTHALFLAMPSLYEGFGLPIVESMVYGTPVLTADNSSMPEVVGDAGLLVDAQSIESITAGLNKLITDQEFRSELAKKTKLNAFRFNWNESAQQLVSVFEKIIFTRG